jgi:phosphoglycolate phosphatase
LPFAAGAATRWLFFVFKRPHFRPFCRVPRFDAVFFDLDGTLIDHFGVLYRCYAATLPQLGLPPPTREQVRQRVGGSMEVTMRTFVSEEQLPEAARLWREEFDRTYLDEVEYMPGGDWLVEALHASGLTLGVLTNKIGHHSRGLMTQLGAAPWLSVVLGAQDTPYRKPMPEFTRHALSMIGSTADRTCLIGDSPWDIQAARGVGMACFCVTTGTHAAPELVAAGADAVYPSLWELGRAVFGLEPAGSPAG